MSELLDYCNSENQRNIIMAYERIGTATGVAREMGVDESNTRTTIRKIKKRAAKAGYSPEHDMTHTVAPGYNVKGTSTMYDDEGNVKLQWVKTGLEQQTFEAMQEEMQVLLEDYRGKSLKINGPKKSDSRTLSVYPMGDPHIGLYSWAEETGNDFDCDIAIALYGAAFKSLMKDATAEQALIINVGDFFHADNSENKTMRSGNALDVDTRFGAVLRVGIGIMKSAIENALKYHKSVKVINAIGNHDDHSAVFLALSLEAFYDNNDRVEIVTKAGKFHYHHFGAVLLGVTHGDTAKLPQLGPIMTRDCIDIISQTKFRTWHTGHLHKDQHTDYVDCTVEIHRTLTPGDAWSIAAGYRSWRSMKRIDYDIDMGEFCRKTYMVNPNANQD